MNLDEINVFGSMESPDDNEEKVIESIEDLEDFDCPILGLIESMYIEPHPYGTTLSSAGIEEILKGIGYKITEKGGIKYALKDGEKLSRSESKKNSQKMIEVYRAAAEKLAVNKFLNDWNNVFGTTGNSGEA